MNILLEMLKGLVSKIFANRQSTSLVFFLVALLILLSLYAEVLTPLLLAAGATYTFTGIKTWLSERNTPMWLAFAGSYLIFFTIFLLTVLSIPALFSEATALLRELVEILSQMDTELAAGKLEAESWITTLASSSGIPEETVIDNLKQIIGEITSQAGQYMTSSISQLYGGISSAITILIYIVVLPILVFYMLKDSTAISSYLKQVSGVNDTFSQGIWDTMDELMVHYIRGKCYEIALVGVAASLLFTAFDLRYGLLLGVLTGLSTIIPVVGALLVTVPIALISLLQFGLGGTTVSLLGLYLILQMVDGYVLVPILFSEVTKLHPLVILSSVFFFGGVFGFWGAFFAVPIATFIRVLVEAWPDPETEETIVEQS